jgi:hypothetical protein
MIADCQMPIADFQFKKLAIGNRKLEMNYVQTSDR